MTQEKLTTEERRRRMATMETELETLLKKVRAGKDLTDEEIEKLPDGKLKTALKKRKEANRFIEKELTEARNKKRTNDTRRKILFGAWLQRYMEKQPDFKTIVYHDLDKSLTRSDERALFDLPPLSPATPVLDQADTSE